MTILVQVERLSLILLMLVCYGVCNAYIYEKLSLAQIYFAKHKQVVINCQTTLLCSCV